MGGRPLKLGEIGCALSHKRCYQKFLNDPEYKSTKYLLILEDDVELDKDFRNILEKEIQKNEENYRWNYLQFNYPESKSIIDIFVRYFEKIKIQFLTFKSKYTFLAKMKRIPYLIFAPFVSTILELRNYFISRSRGSYRFFKILPLAGAYLVDKRTAKILLKLTDKIVEASDIVLADRLYKYRNLKFYFYSPLVARQNREEFVSNIQD